MYLQIASGFEFIGSRRNKDVQYDKEVERSIKYTAESLNCCCYWMYIQCPDCMSTKSPVQCSCMLCSQSLQHLIRHAPPADSKLRGYVRQDACGATVLGANSTLQTLLHLVPSPWQNLAWWHDVWHLRSRGTYNHMHTIKIWRVVMVVNAFIKSSTPVLLKFEVYYQWKLTTILACFCMLVCACKSGSDAHINM